MSEESLGRHVLVELYNCNPELLNNVSGIEKIMVDAAEHSQATVINVTFHHFSPYGVSGVVVIQESHLTIHTWPEYGYAAIDIFTCGNTVDPWQAYEFLKEALEASNGSTMELKRGQTDLLERSELEKRIIRDEKSHKPNPVYKRNVWFTERDENMAISLRHDGDLLFSERSLYQKVEVYNTYAYGKMLALDGLIMCTERDEHVYHELISHVPLFTHNSPKKVLVIGGGDGGTVREVLKHDNVEEVVMVEIDEMVVSASKEFLPTMSCAFNDSRLNLIIDDGIEYLKNCKENIFDIIIVDNSDPVGPSEGIFTKSFYRDVYKALKKDGIMVGQSESPRFNVKVYKELYQTLRDVFGKNKVHSYLGYVPTYPSGMWSFSFCTKTDVHPVLDFDENKFLSFLLKNELVYYNNEVHKAAFAQPNFVKELHQEKIGV
jgi:spermidine synthase